VLPPGLALGASVVERFKREAQMAASLDHPNIIPIYRVGQTSSMLYLAMRYVEGRPLDSVIAQQGALAIPAVVAVLRSAVAALAYAHEHGIIHRDIKGANILIDTSGRVIVTDFGVARAIENASMTTTGSVIGTPYFMSPEACAGKVAGPQSDQYSLGVVVFQMLTGAVPFHADTLAAIMNHHLITPVPDITGVRKDVPAPLVAVLKRMLMKDPAQRYGTTRELLVAVDAARSTRSRRKSCRRWPTPWGSWPRMMRSCGRPSAPVAIAGGATSSPARPSSCWCCTWRCGTARTPSLDPSLLCRR
jgi:serine/threonine protein kinase